MYSNHNNKMMIVFCYCGSIFLNNAKCQQISVGQPNCIENKKINIDIFIDVNLSPLT